MSRRRSASNSIEGLVLSSVATVIGGTGMAIAYGLKQNHKHSEAVAKEKERYRRIQEREANRQLKRDEIEKGRAEKRSEAEREVLAFEQSQSEKLSLHTQCGPSWNWGELAGAQPPRRPPTNLERSDNARRELESYQPSFWDKAFFSVRRKKAQLDARLALAESEDAQANALIQLEHEDLEKKHQLQIQTASQINLGNVQTYQEVLDKVAPFSKLTNVGLSIQILSLKKDVTTLRCLIDRRAVPCEEKILSASGKVTVKTLPQTAQSVLHARFVSSCALRSAREIFSLLPVTRVVVNVAEHGVDTSTGHNCLRTLLAISMERWMLEGFRFENVDPVAALKYMPHRMSLKKSIGLEPVEAMTDAESFVSIRRIED